MGLSRIITILCSLSCAFAAHAQLDPSSALLLEGGSRDVRENIHNAVTDSARYTVRPRSDQPGPTPAPRPNSRRSSAKERGESTEPVTVTVPASNPPPATPTPLPPSASPENSFPAMVYVPAANSVLPSPTPSIIGPPAPVVVRADDLQFRVRDWGRRLNILEISFAPGYLYNGSDSVYAYRNYSVAVPVLAMNSTVWLTPGVGLAGSYVTSINGSVSDSLNGTRNAAVSQNWFTAGLRFRKFYLGEIRNSSLTLGVDYSEYDFRVSSDARLREKLISNGAKVTLDAEMPASASLSWTLGIEVAPILGHAEGSTNVSFASGGSVNASSVGVSIGQRYQFSRFDAIYWKLSHTIERDLFSGAATLADPLTGVAPTGVSVTNSFTILQFGYAWGD